MSNVKKFEEILKFLPELKDSEDLEIVLISYSELDKALEARFSEVREGSFRGKLCRFLIP